MKKNGVIFILVFLFFCDGCAQKKPASPSVDAPLLKLREALTQGNYAEAVKLGKEISSQVPAGNNREEALYLLGYTQAYGKSNFADARLPLKELLDHYPNGPYAADSQKLLADCQYWQGHYETAGREYKKLFSTFGEKGFAGYAQLQEGHCLLLDDKVGDALSSYRDVVEKYPNESTSTSAQLMVANSYLKLQNFKQAKVELRKLMVFTKNQDIQEAAQKTLRQIEEEEPFKKEVGVSD